MINDYILAGDLHIINVDIDRAFERIRELSDKITKLELKIDEMQKEIDELKSNQQ